MVAVQLAGGRQRPIFRVLPHKATNDGLRGRFELRSWPCAEKRQPVVGLFSRQGHQCSRNQPCRASSATWFGEGSSKLERLLILISALGEQDGGQEMASAIPGGTIGQVRAKGSNQIVVQSPFLVVTEP
jgi:hypothetical protein